MSTTVLDWLLEDDAPGVQYLARARLLGESPRSRRMLALRRRCNDYPPVAKMLKGVDRIIASAVAARKQKGKIGDYSKYKGAFWTLMFLAEMHADGRDPRIKRLCEHVLGTQLADGGFAVFGNRTFELVCLTANMLRSLVHLGYGDDERVISGYKRLAERIIPHGGVPCFVLQYCLHTSCKMTLPQTLRCVAIAPAGVPKKKLKDLRDTLVKEMLGVAVYQYMRPDVKLYRLELKKRPKGVKERKVRDAWIAKHKVPNSKLLPKPGWLRFGFPSSYNPDLLEAMLALTEIGAKHDERMNDALDHIESKRCPDGTWKMDESLNGKMLADVERKGQPSKWITLRALGVLQHFGRVEV